MVDTDPLRSVERARALLATPSIPAFRRAELLAIIADAYDTTSDDVEARRAVADGRAGTMRSEVAIAAVFIVAAVAGFRHSPWIAVVALGGHGVMDAFHHHLVHNRGVPQAWPGFCMAFDVVAALIVAGLMLRRDRGAPGRSMAGATS